MKNKWWSDDELMFVIKKGLPTDRTLYSDEDIARMRRSIELDKLDKEMKDKAKIKEVLYEYNI